MLELKNLTKIYNNTKYEKIIAVDNMNLKFSKTGLVFILGRSGCGKTTLLNLIGGLDNYDSGDIIISNKSTKTFKQSDYDDYRNRCIGFVFQEHNLLDELTVEKNIELALSLQNINNKNAKIEDVLKSLEIEELRNKYPNELSTGQKQRVAIARAVIKSPRIILADEPTGSLDLETGKIVLEKLKEISEKMLVIVVTHNRDDAQKYGERIIDISCGKLVQDSILQTDETKLYDSENNKFTSKALPFKFAGLLALRMMKFKKLRLILTILIIVLTLSLFGFFDTISNFDENKSHLNGLKNNDSSYLALHRLMNDSNIYLNDDNIKSISEQFPKNNFQKAFEVANRYLDLSDFYYDADNKFKNEYYNHMVSYGIDISETMLSNYGFSLVSGNLPRSEDEIAITKYQFSKFQLADYSLEGVRVRIEEPEDILWKTVTIKRDLDEIKLKIVGVIDTNLDQKYEILKKSNDDFNINLRDEFSNILSYGLHNVLFFKDGYFEEFINVKSRIRAIVNQGEQKRNDYFLDSINTMPSNENVYFNPQKIGDVLTSNEVIINIESSLATGVFMYKIKNLAEIKIEEQFMRDYQEITQSMIVLGEVDATMSVDVFKILYKYNVINGVERPYINIKYNEFLKIAAGEFMDDGFFKSLNPIEIFAGSDFMNLGKYVVVGIDISDPVSEYEKNTLYVSEETHGLYEEYSKNIGFIVTPLSKNDKENLKILEYVEKSDYYEIDNEFTVDLNRANYFFGETNTLFLVGGVIFGTFAILLLLTFINISISERRKDIGILRAIGAKGKDIIKIFFYETLIITLICIIFSIIFSIVATLLFLDFYENLSNVQIHYFLFGIRQVLLIIIISFIVSFAATSIPILLISKKRPIEIIRLANE